MYKIDDLRYDYGALEPVIDRDTMVLHHDKHHMAYLNKMNALLEKYNYSKDYDLIELVNHIDFIDVVDREAFLFNYGGVVNHNLFFKIMGPSNHEPFGLVLDAINAKYGSFTAFKEAFIGLANTMMGSGWVMLVMKDNELDLIKLKNQDNPYILGYKPLIAIDLWEHAYYLKYRNVRPDYINAFFDVVDFAMVNALYEEER